MATVVELQPVKHIYDVDHCAGCTEEIQGEYMELGLSSGNGKEMRHIALCNKCDGIARKAGTY